MQKEPTENSVYVHRFIASYLYLASSLTSIPAMLTHVNEVISARVDECPWLLPGPAPTSHPNSPGSLQLADKYLFNMKSIGKYMAIATRHYDPLTYTYCRRCVSIYIYIYNSPIYNVFFAKEFFNIRHY